ncbi:MAG: glycosyltransferase [Verrucomicrobia bacterium]|jgi:glycosyltransferase involved in cell wall biosynthesis|nr:glycosyltransferase [Verrucomicrobiota bacterium]MBT7068624.1 glycosyltransferase [Verrucomicrobiota bacterium]
MTNPDKPHSPLFSIVTVCLNPGDDLASTVDSVLSQAFDDYELLIKDGGSEDGTQTIHWEDPRIRVESSPDDGIYDAMNQALEKCSGNYVVFMNAGDIFYDAAVLSRLASLVLSADRPAVVYCDVHNRLLNIVLHYPEHLSRQFLYRKTICHQATFVRRDCFTRFGRFDASLPLLADYDLLLRLIIKEGQTYRHASFVGTSYQDGGTSAAPEAAAERRTQVRIVRARHMALGHRLLFGALWHATLPRLRAHLYRRCGHPGFRKAYASTANLFTASKLSDSPERPGKSSEKRRRKEIVFLFANRPQLLLVNVFRLLNAQDEYRVRLVYMNRARSRVSVPMNDLIRPEECVPITWPDGKRFIGKLFNRLVMFFLFSRQAVRLKPDIIHAWNLEMLIAARLAQVFLPRAKLGYTLQDTAAWMMTGPMIALQRRLYRRVALTFVTSRGFESEFLRKFGLVPEEANIVHIPNAPTRESFIGFSARAHVRSMTIGYIGAFKGALGIETLVAAAREARIRGAEIGVLFAGIGLERLRVERLAAETDFVSYAGEFKHNDIPALYGQVDALYAVYDNSYDKQIHLACRFCEGICFGIPVIVGEETHMAELTRTLGVGASVQLGNVSALTDLLVEWSVTPGLRRTMVEQCAAARGDYTFESYASRINDAYARLWPESMHEAAESNAGLEVLD